MSDYLKDTEFGTICVCAVRYALGRQTYMPGLVQEFVKTHIYDIETQSLMVMRKDIIDRRDNPCEYLLGDPKIDRPSWLIFLSFITTAIKLREENDKE